MLLRQRTLQVALVPDETSYASAPWTAVQFRGRVRAEQSKRQARPGRFGMSGHPQ